MTLQRFMDLTAIYQYFINNIIVLVQIISTTLFSQVNNNFPPIRRRVPAVTYLLINIKFYHNTKHKTSNVRGKNRLKKSTVYKGSVLCNKLPNYCQTRFYVTLTTSLKHNDILDAITNFDA